MHPKTLLLVASLAHAQNLVMVGMGVYDDDEAATSISPLRIRQAVSPGGGGASSCTSGQQSCDSTCIRAGATCCRLGNNAFCDAGEYCTNDNTCCPLGQGCPGPGECKSGTVRCGIGCIPAGFTCCTDHYCL
jgi:hypothetical protein